MPRFCRHGRLAQNCPICSREEAPAAPPPTPVRRRTGRTSGPSPRPARRRGSNLQVRTVGVRGPDDGYENPLVPGLRSSEDAARLADEIAFACARLAALEQTPSPDTDVEVALRATFEAALEGPRGATDAERARSGFAAWLERSGSARTGLAGDPGWTPQRRFGRAYERLGIPGLGRDARFDFLVVVGRQGLVDLRADALHLGGDDEVTVAAKRVWGIGDLLLLERRAAVLAEAAELDVEALDLALFNWGREERVTSGVAPESSDAGARDRVRRALVLG